MTILGKTTPLALVALMALSACGGGGGGGGGSTSSSSGGQTGAQVDVTPCQAQSVTPTRSDTREPWRMRLSWSRPNESVPSQ